MSQSTELRPVWKRWFWWYLLGVLLIPVFGLGLFLIWRVYSKNKYISYRVTNQKIRSIDREFSQSVDIANINKVNVHQPAFLRFLNVGDLLLETGSRTVTIKGQENPQKLADMLEQAIRAELMRLKELNKIDYKPEPHPTPGTLDRMDYLTGLWQQGLITDEDFQKERKHFEKRDDSGE